MTDFNLSEKEIDYSQYPLSTSAFLREDVKKFIRLLKDKSHKDEFDNSVVDIEEIDKLAGEKLV